MSALLTGNLPLIADAPEGIRKLRGLILELAVRGRLVPQVPSGKQSGWRHGSFGDIFHLEYGDSLPAPKRSESGEYPVYGSNGIVGTHEECRVTSPCIVVGRKGSAGALNLCRQSGCWVTDVAYYCIPPSSVDLDFAFIFFHTLGLDELGKGIKPGLSRSEAYALPVAIPPLAEQHRIVAKVDELMALCDRLEAEQADADAAHARLVDALLAALTRSTDAADFAANWQRLAAHFDTLFTTEAAIDALKQTVLQLAVTGKLVPQDPTDEPASELLKRIAEMREERLASGYPNINEAATQLRKQQEQSRPSGLARLPEGWSWATLMQSAELVVDCHNKTAPYSSSGIPLLRTTNIRDGSLNLREPKFVTNETYERWSARCKPQSGDLLITREAPMGEACIIPEGMTVCMGQRMMLIRLVPETIHPQFLLHTLLAPDMMERVQDKPVGATVEHLRVGGVETLLVAIPPLAEQNRIVAKVNELITLCDRLKADLASARQRQATLADTLIAAALEAA